MSPRAGDGPESAPGDLTAAADVLTDRLAAIDGVQVRVQPPNSLVVTAPGSDKDTFTGLLGVGNLALRTVVGSGHGSPGSAGATSVETTGGGIATSKRAAGSTERPAFPLPHSDQQVPTQPATRTGKTAEAWVTAAATAIDQGSVGCGDLDPYLGRDTADRALLGCDQPGETIYLLRRATSLDAHVQRAAAGQLQQGTGWGVTVQFDGDGAKTLSDYTTAHVGQQVAFVLDGTVLSAPIVQAPITGDSIQISGGFTVRTAKAFAAAIDAGPMPVRVVDVQVMVQR